MIRLLILLVFLGSVAGLAAQHPHGADMKMDCAACHTAVGWEIEPGFWQKANPGSPVISRTTGMELGADSTHFNHSKTQFELKGRHSDVDCRACHQTLVFKGQSSECISCHTDMHQQTAGTDCARCHTINNWLVDNITELHQQNGFPLTGVHQTVDCRQCHNAGSDLIFNRIGNDCISCHQKDFNASTNPNHRQAGFSTECLECHDLFTNDWTTDQVNHDFFPLTKGHEITDCAKCHTAGDYASTPNTCVSCHQQDFEGALSPNHIQAGFTNECATCHTTDPDWMPAQFQLHDAEYFPIYSGKHLGQWTQCADCHTNASNYQEFSCTVCHVNPETNDGHSGVNGYVYENTACLGCHPTGDADVVFDHNNTSFPLTGAHLSADCIACHAAGYAGTTTTCASCHTPQFTGSTNPNHVALGIPTDCDMCHTTNPGWDPATFPIHNNYYTLNGAHAVVANDCAACHNGNYNNTPNTCNGCHNPEYVQTTNPNHVAAQFPTDCATCHTETAWTPSKFDHNTIYPFTGAHVAIANDCAACHNGNYNNTPNTCEGCHMPQFTGSTNPNHVALGIPTDCDMCHTTNPGWDPATFPIHNNYYPLNGAHAVIANDCAACHNGNYNNTPNTCFGCHSTEYNSANNPNHASAQFPTTCQSCHTETVWTPSTFNHDQLYFPIYSGKHEGEWNQCNDCHTNPNNYAIFSCIDCHEHDNPSQVANDHQGVAGYSYTSSACFTCHPNGN